ncbi:MAG TPA: hypothetical protein VJ850_14810 [Candidatus Limnocylindrales bacterium]|nr:hypothetical protein [Candidatus Limnocylindrales bacterium]
MKICDVCRASNEPEAEFCGTCGSRLPVSPATGDAAATAALPQEPEPVPTATQVVDTSGDDETVVPGSTPTKQPATDPSAGAAKSGAKAAAKPVDPTPVAGTTSSTAPSPAPQPAPWNTGKAAPKAVVTCQVCQTENEADREFCKKCASPLRAVDATRPRLVTRGFVARFLLSFLIGVAVPVGGAAAVTAFVNQPKDLPATPVSLTLQGGEPLDFEITPTAEGQSEQIGPLPPTTTVQLTSYKEAVAATPEGQNIDAKWWNDGIPRVPAISQFDGGPLQKVNCTLASGAMLARLAFGIVTTGSQLRRLQSRADGGTNFDNLNEALDKGWRVKVLHGALTALQLRALSFAGAGIVLSLDYGAVPENVRLQRSFTGGHAVYVDAFTPNGPDGKPAYWVMDPIGHTWAGYKGGWWPAADVERAALARNGGWISAAWAFAGGRIPDPRPKLPADAYPGANPPDQPSALPTIGPPIEDPMPTGDTPDLGDPPIGDPPPETPVIDGIDFDSSVFELDPGTSFAKCAVLPAPTFCPRGIIGIIDLGGGSIATKPPLRTDIDILYADVLGPGTYQVVFETPPGTDGSLFLWTGTSGSLREAQVDDAFVDGKDVKIATITMEPNTGFSFFTTATGDGYKAVSDVGSMTITK